MTTRREFMEAGIGGVAGSFAVAPTSSLPMSSSAIEAEWRKLAALGRENFYVFRQLIRPRLIHGIWQIHMAQQLQQFYEDLMNGLRPKLIIQAPPQHGKTEQLEDFIAWVAGKDPNIKTIFASYSEDLGIRVNMDLQRLYDGKSYQRIFGATKISTDNVVTVTGRHLRNSSILEYIGKRGHFRNTTVMGQVTGQGLDLGVVDDPVKGRAEAQSQVTRDKTWNWLMDDFLSRFSDGAGFIFTMTRWHLDDPSGRFQLQFPEAKVLRYPALAEDDDILGRLPGEPLFPEHKSLEFLMERKRAFTRSSWESLYQQNPIVIGGGIFPIEQFQVTNHIPYTDVKKSVRYWDKAGTEGGGAYTAGVLLHSMKDGRYIVNDVRRGQWSALEREKRIKQTSISDAAYCKNYEVWIEQEPGSGGKESAENTVRMLAGFSVYPDKVSKDKGSRADPYAAQVQNGNVLIRAGEWNRDFLDEHEHFPNGKYKDQVDAAAGAFNKLAKVGYDSSLSWLGY